MVINVKIKKNIELTEADVKSIIADYLEDNGYSGITNSDIRFKIGSREEDVFRGFTAYRENVPHFDGCIVEIK